MHRPLLRTLCCPRNPDVSDYSLVDRVIENNARSIRSLHCRRCGRDFPLVDGIFDFVTDSDTVEYGTFAKNEACQWDAHAAKYDLQRARDPLYLACCRAAAQALLPIHSDELVLDVGCGTGMVTDMYFSGHIKLVCVDLSLDSLRLLRQRLVRPRSQILCVRADATLLPFRDATFSKVICANTIQHLPSTLLRQRLVDELARVAAPGSDIVVTAHNYSMPKRWRGWAKEGEAGSMSGRVQYIYRFARNEFKSLLMSKFRVKSICAAGLPLPYRLKLSPLSSLLERWWSQYECSALWGHMLVAKCVANGKKLDEVAKNA